jgi:hypothetical protein
MRKRHTGEPQIRNHSKPRTLNLDTERAQLVFRGSETLLGLYRTLLGNLCILMYGEIKIKIKFFST